MKSMTWVGGLPVRKIVMLLFAGLIFSSLSVAAERPDKERKMQMKKAKEYAETNADANEKIKSLTNTLAAKT